MSGVELDLAVIEARLVAMADEIPLRVAIHRDGTCDGCAESKHLVASYPEPDGEPWLCAECDLEVRAIGEGVPALVARVRELEAEVVEVTAQRDNYHRMVVTGQVIARVTPCACSAQRARAEAAEAVVARVEALATKFEHWPSSPSLTVTARSIRDALATPATTEGSESDG